MNNKKSLFKKIMKKTFDKKLVSKMNQFDFELMHIIIRYLEVYLHNIAIASPEHLQLRAKLIKAIPKEMLEKVCLPVQVMDNTDLSDIIWRTAYALEKATITVSPEILEITGMINKLFVQKPLSITPTSSTTAGTISSLSSISPCLADSGSASAAKRKHDGDDSEGEDKKKLCQ